ncbi:MAG: hypothetical protein ACXVCP_03095 [Bdellovibrio sp.]
MFVGYKYFGFCKLPIDPRNAAAEELIEELRRLQIPVFSNVNIREMIPIFIGKYG